MNNSKNSWDEIRGKKDRMRKLFLTLFCREMERFRKREREREKKLHALDASRHITEIIFREQKERKFARYQVSLNRR